MATITGGSGDDTLSGGGGDDVVSGKGGNDNLNGGSGDDYVLGGDGDDTITGETGDDTIYGGDGDDSIRGWSDNDYIDGGSGNDILEGDEGANTIFGGTGDDYISLWIGADSVDGGDDRDTIEVYDGFGNDTIAGGEGGDDYDTLELSTVTGPVTATYTGDEAGTIADGTDTITFSEIEQLILTDQADAVRGGADSTGITVDGRGGDDSLDGGSGDDTLLGGAGNDSLLGNEGDDSLSGGDGSDSIYGGNGADTISGGAGNDQLGGEAGADVLDGGAGADTLDGGADNDVLSGQDGDDALNAGAGDDTIDGGAGDDFILGQSGDDSITGGAGNDTIRGGIGNDTITTGTGDDLVVFEQNAANDTVTDFDISDTDNNGNSNDQLDVSALRDLDGNPVNIWDVVVSDDGSGNAVLSFPEGETLTLQGITPAQMTGPQMVAAGIPCYAPGTLIETPDGPRPVEELQIGDLVNTLDHGPQPIRWVRRGDHPLDAVDADGKPVLIAAGALGKGLPTQDLIVSPQHRMLVGGRGQLDDWFKTESLAPAKSLTTLQGIRHIKGKQKITWIHFACDRHEVVTANGCLSESLLLGPMVVNGLTNRERCALVAIYGTAPMQGAALNGPAARACLKVGDVRRRIATCKQEKAHRTAKEIRKWGVDLAMEQSVADRFALKQTKGQKPDLRLLA